MSYVSKREKVFDLPEQEVNSVSSLKTTEARLKSFPSVSDKRAWTTEEQQRYQHLYGLVSGSETNVTKTSSGFKYIPFDVLLSILMAEKDAYIQELLERQDDKSCSGGKLYKAEGFEDSDDDRDALIRKDAQMLSLKNKIAGLESELEDYRETLTKAMHKLENMDAIITKNNLLQEKLKCAEESIKLLEKQKMALENELWSLKRTSESDSEIDDERGCLRNVIWEKGDCDDINRLASERDILKSQVEDLQKELERAKANAAEINNLRKISETTSNTLEEITKENTNYKKKLEAMKCLEKHVEELKQEAHILTDKYKRESERANDQLKRINLNAKELQLLREERDRLQKRVDELIPFENQYISLQSKLYEVEMILDENEALNKKLSKLEEENEHLKMKIDQLEEAEIKATADKEKILQLQCEVMDQEEEIQRMLRQIEDLSDGYTNKNELYELRKELEEKNGKLKNYERQVTQIPILESEIEELRNKLQKCIDDFRTHKNLLEKLQDELETCKNRCQELEELAPSSNVENNTNKSNEPPLNSQHFNKQVLETINKNKSKGMNTDFVRMQEAASQSPVLQFAEQCIETTLDDIQFELRKSKERNESLQKEVEVLTSKLFEMNSDSCLRQTSEMKELLNAKEERIIQLETEIVRLKKEFKNFEDLNRNKFRKDREDLEHEIANLNEINAKLMGEIEIRHKAAKRANELETVLSKEKKARVFAQNLIKELEQQLQNERKIKEMEMAATKLRKEEANIAKQEFYRCLSSEISIHKVFKTLSTKVINELKVENKILREYKEYSEKVEIFALKGLIKNLRAKVKALKNLSKPEHQADYKSVQEKIKLLLLETNNLVDEINTLKEALDAEKKTKDFLEKELINLQTEIAECLTARNKVFDEELEARNVYILELKKELTKTHQKINDSVEELNKLKEENTSLINTCQTLRSEQKYLKSEIARLTSQIEEQNNLENEINSLSEKIEEQKKIDFEFGRLSAKENKMETEHFERSQSVCAIKEHENLEKEVTSLIAQIQDQKEKLIELENKEKEYINEMVTLKKCMEERETDLLNFKALEGKLEETIQELKNELLIKENEAEKIKEILKGCKSDVAEEKEITESVSPKINEPNDLSMLEIKDLKIKCDSEESCMVEHKYALEKAMKKLENEFDEFIFKLNESDKTEEEIAVLKIKRNLLLQNLADLEGEIQLFKNKLGGFDDSNNCEQKSTENTDNLENISDLILKLEQKQLEVEDMKAENENLKKELSKAEGILEISKKLHKTVSQIQTLPSSGEYFTTPAFPSPRSTDGLEVEQETVPLEVHQKELADMENRFNLKIQKLKEAHSKKIKKLSSFHEKDIECRIKTFNDSINNTKSNYESDIRKLVEKHKLSIAKLLEFHENDVKELNRIFETQMVTLEKQNKDLMEDMRLKSLEKCKSMEEQHSREIQEISLKYEGKLKEKEIQTQAEIKNLEMNMSLKAEDLQEVNKRTVDNLTQFYQKSILEMKEKHDKELKKCKKNHLKNVELMKSKYEDLLMEERKKYEEQLEEMLNQLKKGQPEADLNEDNLNELIQKRVTTTSNPSFEFVEVLQKILRNGLESLTFPELILVHSKTCFIPEIVCDHDERGDGALNEFAANGCKHKKLMTAEREELLKRIFTLEREIFIKQFETREANSEGAEGYRIQELKKALSAAQQKNNELKKHLTNQSKFQMDMKIEKYMMDRQAWENESNVVEKVKELEREKAEKKRLEEELQREKANAKNLSTLLESEKERFRSQRKRDLEYVEFMRFKLEETLKHEQIMESQLDNEARFRVELESELQSLQKSFNLIADNVSAPVVESKTDKDYRNFDRCDSKKVEKVGFRNRSRSRHKSASKVLLNS